ncbi:MAG TPA: tRNA-intron lyase [Candidatus Nanoarchaeia archaeon]|nr:tRNA-intron lyase [Candidatus Nanoarchaeia archaeon]
MIKASLSAAITSTSSEAFSLHEKSLLGEKANNKIEYMPTESLFLASEKKLTFYHNEKPLSEEQALKKIKKQDPRIEEKLVVFSDLRKKGYLVKSALKFGADFRVYDKGIRPSEDHARWLVFILKETSSITPTELAAKNRIAHSTKKKLLLAIVDSESDVSYYETNWIKI